MVLVWVGILFTLYFGISSKSTFYNLTQAFITDYENTFIAKMPYGYFTVFLIFCQCAIQIKLQARFYKKKSPRGL